MPLIVAGTIAFTIAGTFIFPGINKLIRFMIKQSIESFLDTVTHQIFSFVMDKFLIYLYNNI